MPTITWTIEIQQTNHTVQLNHGLIGGLREIRVDGLIVERSRKFFDNGSRHAIEIGGKPFEVWIMGRKIGYEYILLDNGQPVSSDHDRGMAKSPGGRGVSPHMADWNFIQELSRQLGLAYQIQPNATWIFRHRLVGLIHGYLVVVRRGALMNPPLDGWSVTIRHAPPLAADTDKRIRTDSRIQSLLGKWAKNPYVQHIAPDFFWIFLPYNKNDTPEDTTDDIRTFVDTVVDYYRPVHPNICENPDCKNRMVRSRRLVFINWLPKYYCDDCIQQIPEWGKKAEEDYRKAPSNLLPELVAGTGAMLFGAVLMGTIGILIGRLMFVIPVYTLLMIQWALRKTGTSYNFLSQFTAIVLTIFSILSGIIFFFILRDIREGAPVGVATFVNAWVTLLKNPELFFMITGATILLGGMGLLQSWLNVRTRKKQAFHPEIEIQPEPV